MSALSNKQKFYLVKDATRAWKALGKPGTFDEFRRAQVEKVTGLQGLRECSQGHYLKLKARFEDLAGNPDKALNTHLRAETNDRRQYIHLIAELIAKHELAPTYADSIARDRFKQPFSECSAEQVLDILKTIKARTVRKRVEKGESYHRYGTRPERKDKKRKPDPLTADRLPALDPDTDANAELQRLQTSNESYV
jgi:acyl-CoA-binding protein